MSVLRASWLLAAVCGFGLAAGGCSVGHSSAKVVQNPMVRPKAFGPAGKCYFIASAAECARQRAPGVPTPMPNVWLATYWPYYASPSYYKQVPTEDEDEYAQRLGNFASQNNTWEGAPDDDPAAADGDDDSGDDDSDNDSSDDSGDDDSGGDDGGDDD
jgi:hypothetical protein